MWRCSASTERRPASRCGSTSAGVGPKPDCGDLWRSVAGLMESGSVELVDLYGVSWRPARLVLHKRRWRCPRRGCPAGTVTEQDREISAAAGAG